MSGWAYVFGKGRPLISGTDESLVSSTHLFPQMRSFPPHHVPSDLVNISHLFIDSYSLLDFDFCGPVNCEVLMISVYIDDVTYRN
jgi:hypothetical protein